MNGLELEFNNAKCLEYARKIHGQQNYNKTVYDMITDENLNLFMSLEPKMNYDYKAGQMVQKHRSAKKEKETLKALYREEKTKFWLISNKTYRDNLKSINEKIKKLRQVMDNSSKFSTSNNVFTISKEVNCFLEFLNCIFLMLYNGGTVQKNQTTHFLLDLHFFCPTLFLSKIGSYPLRFSE